jgi:hypothetical protein
MRIASMLLAAHYSMSFAKFQRQPKRSLVRFTPNSDRKSGFSLSRILQINMEL